MLPSSGFFKDVVCPFFKGGLCERPHCHFKHAEPDAPTQVVSRSNLFSLLSAAESSLNKSTLPSTSAPLTYIPTPVEKCTKGKPQGILKAPNIAKPEKAIPEYRPTPISRLKDPVADEDKASTSTAFKKRRYEEYVPEEVKRRKVTFTLPDDAEGIEDEVSPEEVSDDDISCVEAKFSDDDYEGNDEGEKFVQPKPQISELSGAALKKNAGNDDKDDKKREISQYSLVDKILGEVSKNEEFIRNFSKPAKYVPTVTVRDDSEENLLTKTTGGLFDSTMLKKTKDSMENNKLLNKSASAGGEKHSNVKKEESSCKDSTKLQKEEKAAKLSSTKKSDKEAKLSKTSSSSKEKLSKKDTKVPPKDKSSSSSKESSKDDSKKSKDHKKSSETDAKSSKSKDQTKLVSKDKKVKESSAKENEKSTSHKTDSKHKVVESKKSSKNSSESSSKVRSGEHDSKKHKTHDSKEHSKDQKSKDKKSEHSSKAGKTDSHKSDSKSKHRSGEHSSKLSSKTSVPETAKVSKKIQDGQISSSGIINKSKKESGSLSELNIKDSQKSKHMSKTNESAHVDKKEYKNKVSVTNAAHSEDYVEDDDIDSDAEDVAMLDDEGDPDSDDREGVSDSDFDSDTYDECLRIFNESSVDDRKDKCTTKSDGGTDGRGSMKNSGPDFKAEMKALKSATKDALSFSKKRVAHDVEFKRAMKQKKGVEAKRFISPAQTMHNRYNQLKQMYDKQNEKKEASSFLNALSKVPEGPRRLVTLPVPSSSLIEAMKNKASMLSSASCTEEEPAPKVIKRIAHIPKVLTKPRPIIPAEYGSKVPSNIRQRYLNTFIDECLKFCITEDQAFEMALDEEKKAYDRSTNKTIYLNVAAISLNRLRKRAVDGPPADIPEDYIPSEAPAPSPMVSSTTSSTLERQKPLKKTLSHETILAGPRAQKTSFSIEKKKNKSQEFSLRGISLYTALLDYLLTEEQLVENGYPMPHETEVGRVVMSGVYAHRQILCNDRYKRICCRCKKTYYVDDDGDYVKEEECDFHWGRIYKRRIAGSIESRYTCCQGDAESDGCCVGSGHVFEGSDYHITRGYVKTLPKTPPPDKYYGVYSLDCEMCYTTAGIELTRVTVINPDLKAVFETFVKPEHRVLDYNTRFSGITEDDLIGVTTTIRDVQAILLCMFNDKTILIGHSLESDLKALKLIHKTVVDTSVVFPHKLGLPHKRALRTLMAEKCNKIIQNDTEGHDSHEDAAACMELMHWKLKEDLKYASR